MVLRCFASALLCAFLLSGVLTPSWAFTKDQSKLPLEGDPLQTAQQTESPADEAAPVPEVDEPSLPDQPGETSLGEVPVITTVELTPDVAKSAVDAFALVRDKYREANLEEFENLQDFVDQAPEGKAFDTDVKGFGFANVTDWNTAITSVGFAYSALTDDQSEEIHLQIEEINKDTTIAQDMKDKMVASLSAMIPSENNKKVVQALAADPSYEEKLKLLGEEE